MMIKPFEDAPMKVRTLGKFFSVLKANEFRNQDLVSEVFDPVSEVFDQRI